MNVIPLDGRIICWGNRGEDFMKSSELVAGNLSFTGLATLSEFALELGRNTRPVGQYRNSTKLEFYGRSLSIGEGFLQEFAVSTDQAKESWLTVALDFGDSFIDLPDYPLNEYVGCIVLRRASPIPRSMLLDRSCFTVAAPLASHPAQRVPVSRLLVLDDCTASS
jgi:hypothetical protein